MGCVISKFERQSEERNETLLRSPSDYLLEGLNDFCALYYCVCLNNTL